MGKWPFSAKGPLRTRWPSTDRTAGTDNALAARLAWLAFLPQRPRRHFPRVELFLAHETCDDGVAHTAHSTGIVSQQHQLIWESIENVDRRWRSIGETRAIESTGASVQECRHESGTPRLGAGATPALEKGRLQAQEPGGDMGRR